MDTVLNSVARAYQPTVENFWWVLVLGPKFPP
jgi:hypothetical protein